MSRHLDEGTCAALKVLERRWALCLLTVLVAGPARFSELKGAVPGVSGRMMTERLRELERDGLLRRTIDPGGPARWPSRVEPARIPDGHRGRVPQCFSAGSTTLPS